MVGTNASDALAAAQLANIATLTLNAYESDDTVILGGTALTAGTIGMGGGSDQVTQGAAALTDVTITLGDSTDTFTSTANNITTSSIKGQGGADTITFGAAATLNAVFVNGNEGVDTINVGGGLGVVLTNTSIVGGSQNDIITLNTSGASTGGRVNGQEGDDILQAGAAQVAMNSTTVFGGNGSDTLNFGGAGAGATFRLSGDLGNDTITGNTGAAVDTQGDRIWGGNGSDTISGATVGANIVGADTLSGGDGADIFDFSNATMQGNTTMEVVTDAAGAGVVSAGDILTLGNTGVSAFNNAILNITDFSSVDKINSVNGTAAVSAIGTTLTDNGAGADTIGVAGTTYFVSGVYNATDSNFTATADNVGTDTLVVFNGGTANSFLLLRGTQSSALNNTTFF